ncbi:hypothetical protein FB451DRAFT_1370277 [Mycena latifolia]|nr:hypothetical protein FB451DRAFT_1370277 [Mycena latifolia]
MHLRRGARTPLRRAGMRDVIHRRKSIIGSKCGSASWWRGFCGYCSVPHQAHCAPTVTICHAEPGPRVGSDCIRIGTRAGAKVRERGFLSNCGEVVRGSTMGKCTDVGRGQVVWNTCNCGGDIGLSRR